MRFDGAHWRMKARRAALALAAMALSAAFFAGSAVHAQGFLRAPSLNIGPRIPTINPNVNPDIAGRAVNNVGRTVTTIRPPPPRLTARFNPHLPYVHYSPNLYPACSGANRDSDGECLDGAVSTAGNGGRTGKKKNGGPRRNVAQAVLDRTIAHELVAEIDGTLSDAQADELARRHRLTRIGSQNFPLVGATIGLFRIADRRPVETVSRELASDASVRSVQPNFRYLLQEQKAALSEGDPAQYALPKLRLPEAHTLARGANVKIAVIDSGIDAKHPELANSIVETYDALGSKEGPHVHGTGIAGAIVSHARLMGSAPAARILAIRAFGVASSGVQSSSFVILKGMDYAAAHGAQIINMSFAGPKDPLIERATAALAAKGIVLVAAAGNAGAKSPPLYPAANPNVIAVSATDDHDRLFSASNRGNYIALAAPGVDIFLPAPDQKYQVTSGTSFSAAFVSGLAALVLERNPALKPEQLRAILVKTARDLGSPGRDDLFGAGEADAYAAVEAAIAASSTPVAAELSKEATKASERPGEQQENPGLRSLTPAGADAVASDKAAASDAVHPAAQ
jgi:subtilisin family serine protease